MCRVTLLVLCVISSPCSLIVARRVLHTSKTHRLSQGEPSEEELEHARHAIGELGELALDKGLERGGEVLVHAAHHAVDAGVHAAHGAHAVTAALGHVLGALAVPIQIYGLYKMVDGLADSMEIGINRSINAYGACEDLSGDGSILLDKSKIKALQILETLHAANFVGNPQRANAVVDLLLQLRELAIEWRAEVQAERERILDRHPQFESNLHKIPSYQVIVDSLKCTVAILAKADTPKGKKALIVNDDLLATGEKVSQILTGKILSGCCEKSTNNNFLYIIPVGGLNGKTYTCEASSNQDCDDDFHPGQTCSGAGQCVSDGGQVAEILYRYVARLIE